MKKILIMGILTLTITHAHAQQWNGATNATGDIYRQGKVGIGLTSSPLYQFVVSGTGVNALFGGTTMAGFSASGNNSSIELQAVNDAWIQITSHVTGTTRDLLEFATNGTEHLLLCTSNSGTYKPFKIYMDNGSTVNALTIWPNGKIGIGTGSTSIGTDTKLAVEGLISCRELKVLPTSTAWPDFVFQNDFKRMSLDDVENYIEENKHLPQLPAAAEVEANGFKVGETQSQILQAVEELYLHVIDLKKENEQLKKELQELKN